MSLGLPMTPSHGVVNQSACSIVTSNLFDANTALLNRAAPISLDFVWPVFQTPTIRAFVMYSL